MGFQESWVAMIMECITTVTYFILVNREPKGLITPTRGLRQDQPWRSVRRSNSFYPSMRRQQAKWLIRRRPLSSLANTQVCNPKKL
ncbi:hypothetical protein SO802_015526 [Lithocarpus litseifolius]|uniref:Ycf15 protein n=1 Tax=Lithocarpus litseifolius TaxID=425828 RepID=A0AAW2CX82_9ROSI